MSKRNWKLYIEDILDSIKKMEKYTSELSYEKFVNNDLVIDAVVRNLEKIGEASRQIESNIKEKYSDIPWKEMAGLRNKIIHEYFDVDCGILWEIVKKDIPELKKKILKIVN